MTVSEPTRCAFVAVLGAPNAGKSTLVNAFVGTKVSIVSPKVQTTRTRVRGVAMSGNAQIVFIDTPGIFRTAKRRLERAMVAAAWGGAADADRLMLTIDAARGIDDDTRVIIDTLKSASSTGVILVLNKIDLVERSKLLALTESLFNEGIFERVFMISAKSGDGIDDLLACLVESAPEGPWMFPEDEVSDVPQRLLAAELTREKVFLNLHEELPYSITVETERWDERPDGSVRIDQTIYVMRDSQRMIVLGKGGSKIRSIGASARKELESLLERRIHLFLHVTVREQWAEDPSRYNAWGLDYNV
ncbi:GTPase Era [Haematospirillum jordaniae]|uniref:GTPase Era n=1 Tax=Haematospirillum jordaniae TaxID=1549855 RepID=A0A143DG93_9PROT|nr:GTPase Era [Haematospirillum jordaniae]AMW35128.1 GTPase Era [Haematospirillum jordaniae]NKD44111.1 GTPase Era [Haematospirillum jordaniae]NKD56489.1 GTPase Era [Haematospirillum jordaniae]NKD58547.1 GTPase Era [Haematospirillum jordaniae]NKD66284.1 GTPase Era [Haematospirillum jordaniae]